METSPLPVFLQSIFIGLSIAAPVGQIGVLAIQRTLQHGRLAGIATGLGAAVADAVYGAIGAFGVAALISALIAAGPWLTLAGSVFMLWLAVQIARRPAVPAVGSLPAAGDLLRHFAGTFVLTLANPSTIVAFIAVFSALAGRSAVPTSPWVMVSGVLLGSALWWLVLAGVVGLLRERFDARWQRRVNWLSALVLGGFAAWQLLMLAATVRH